MVRSSLHFQKTIVRTDLKYKKARRCGLESFYEARYSPISALRLRSLAIASRSI
jgi:hypothetical protein